MLSEWESAIDPNGLVTPHKDRSISHNGLMYTTWLVYYCVENLKKPELQSRHAELTLELERIKSVYDSCYVPNGGFNRAPQGYVNKALTQNDDYIGIAWASQMLNTQWARMVLDVSRNNWGILNNIEPGKFWIKAWIFRMPWVKTHLELAAGEKPGPLSTAVWCAYILFSLTKMRKHRDSRIKAFMLCKVAQGKNHIMDSVIAIYMRRFKDIWDGGIGEAEYFSAEHPVTKNLWGWY